MIEKNINNKEKETAVLVAVYSQKQPIEKTKEHLEELNELCHTLGIEIAKQFTQSLEALNSKTFIGIGKVNEIKSFIEEHSDISMVIFDDDLSPSQVKNLEEMLQKKVLDRNLLILDIFAMHAKTSQAKKQVELAQYQYLLPRLTRMWTHLSRQKGGIGMRGPGERELETDRRIVQQKISLLKEKLSVIEKQNETQRKMRDKMVKVAIVGYTNTGKSTLMNILSKTQLIAEDKLFATLDSTVRKVVIKNIPFLLSDTVGFIRKLPHTLIECFKSTLNEVINADLLLHVVDISNNSFDECIEVVHTTLEEIKANKIPSIMVFNKIDKININQEEIYDISKKYSKLYNKPIVFISAKNHMGIEGLKNNIYNNIIEKNYEIYPNYLLDE